MSQIRSGGESGCRPFGHACSLRGEYDIFISRVRDFYVLHEERWDCAMGVYLVRDGETSAAELDALDLVSQAVDILDDRHLPTVMLAVIQKDAGYWLERDS